MNWLVYLVAAVLVVFALQRLLPSPFQLNVATNALLAEHLLQFIELVPENPFAAELRDKVIVVWRHVSDQDGLPADLATREFNASERTVQLCVLALAFHTLKHDPLLRGESWCRVRVPFKAPDGRHMAAVRSRIAAKHGIRIDVPQRPFRITSWGISDA